MDFNECKVNEDSDKFSGLIRPCHCIPIHSILSRAVVGMGFPKFAGNALLVNSLYQCDGLESTTKLGPIESLDTFVMKI